MDIDKFRNNFAMIAAFTLFMFFVYTPDRKKKIKAKISETAPPILEENETEVVNIKDNKNEKKKKNKLN